MMAALAGGDAADARNRSLAARQWQDYRRGTPGTYFAEGHPALSLEDAYAVQREVAAARCAAGDRVAGYKVGCVGAAIVAEFGMTGPIHGRIFASELHASRAALEHAGFANLAIEAEMAIRIGADGEIASAFPVIELHNFVLRQSPRSLTELIANNGLHAGVVVAPSGAARAPGSLDPTTVLGLSINGGMIDAGALWAMDGGAAESLAWLRASLSRERTAPQPGDLILTGTPLGLHPVRPGDRVTVTIDGDPVVTCRII